MYKKWMLLIACNVGVLCHASEHNVFVPQKKIGIFSAQNKREYQEDFFYYGTIEGGKLYAVYDGHCCHRVSRDKSGDNDGSAIAKFLAEKFSGYFSQTSGSMQERMMTAFKNVDNDDFVKMHKECGSTAAIVFVKNNIAHCSHVGNSRILLESVGNIDFVTNDHVPSRADEHFRIKYSKGIVFNNRVNGFLSISRAFGDYGLDKRLIIAEPDYREISLTKNHQFLVLATNGLWQMVGNEEVVGILNEKRSTIQDMNLLAKMLAMFAITRGSRDNITVMLVDLLS